VKKTRTEDLRIDNVSPLISPAVLAYYLPLSDSAADTVEKARAGAEGIMKGTDDRLMVVVGPCSIHDTSAAIEYAERLKPLIDRYEDDLLIMMRVYFEKPRTTVGWKGLINDPHLDGSFDINRGLRIARELLLQLNELGVSAGTEFLDTISPQYYADLISWGAIGARTTESQIHRELASGLSMPVGFKNGTGGSIQIALDAIDQLNDSKLSPHVMVDCSHGNSLKDFNNQPKVAADICEQIANGSTSIGSVMVESNLVEGNQKLGDGDLSKLTYGQSVTDACVSWQTTEEVLEGFAKAVQKRRS